MKGSDFSPTIGSPEKDQNQIDILANRIAMLEEEIAQINSEVIKFVESGFKGFEDAIKEKAEELRKKKERLEKELEIDKRDYSYLIANQITEKFDKKSFSRLIKNINGTKL